MSANFTPTLNGYTGQQPFRFWCQTALPLIYDDSLSYYELLNKMVVYLNNVISDVGNMESNINALLSAYNQLQNYVNTYFDNLDVQEEINNKLDAMALDGSLLEVIKPYIDPVFDEQNAIIDEQNQTIADQTLFLNRKTREQDAAIDVLQSRMDTFASLPTGSVTTDADAELVDIRVGYEGTTYPTAGDAVRGQVSDLNSDLSYISDNTNLFDENATTDGMRLNENGIVTSSGATDYFVSDYMPVIPNKYVKRNNAPTNTYRRIAVYDANGIPISGQVYTDNIIQIPSNGFYVRICANQTEKATTTVIVASADDCYARKTNDELLKSDNNLGIIATSDDFKYNGGIIASSGEVYNTTTYKHTDYIPVCSNKKMIVTNPTFATNIYFGLSFYDSMKTFISGVRGRQTGESKYEEVLVDIPANANYVRFSFSSKYLDHFYAIDNRAFVLKRENRVTELNKDNLIGMQLFQKIGVIGDSISCGYSLDKNGNVSERNLVISWPQQMARRIGSTVYNLGCSGVDPVEWFDPSYPKAQYCYEQYQDTEECDLYIIGLGLNTATLGSISDINSMDYTQNGLTFYGQYARIIQMINDEHPNSIVMCLTEPTTRISTYDQAVRNICELNFINAQLLDLENDYFDLFNTHEMNAEHLPDNLHYTPYGYSLIADAMMKSINNYISIHPTVFKYVGVEIVT